MKYDVILFDADQTLFDFEKSEKFALEKTIEKLGFTYNEQDHLRIYHALILPVLLMLPNILKLS